MARIFNVGRKRTKLEFTDNRKVIFTVIEGGTFVGSGVIVGGKIGKNLMVGLTVISSLVKPIEHYQQKKKLLGFLVEKYRDEL